MNAIRQIVTPDALGNLPMQVPLELRQRPVEVIVLPLNIADDSLLALLTGQNAVENARTIIRKAKANRALAQSVAVLQQEAAQNGLTPALLDDLLRDDE